MLHFFPNSKILIKSSDAVGILKLNRHLFVFDFFFFAEKGKDGQASRARSQVNDIPKNSDNTPPPHNK